MIYLITQQKISYPGIEKAKMEDCIHYLSTRDWVSLDTETQGFNLRKQSMLMLQLGDRETQFVIDCTTIDITPLKPLLEGMLCIMHNAKFDWQWMYKYGFDLKKIYCTFLGEAILTTGLEEEDRHLSLEACAKKYEDAELDKTIRGKIHKEGLSRRVIEYAAEDVMYLYDIMLKQMERINELELQEISKLENEVVRVFALMEYNGVRIDATKWLEVAEIVEENIRLVEEKLDNTLLEEIKNAKGTKQEKLKVFLRRSVQYDLFQEVDDTPKVDVNWSSNAQKLKILRTLDINVFSVDSRTLTKIRKRNHLIPLLIEYNKAAKLESSFGRKFIKEFVDPETGLIHPNYFQIVSTGRISSSDPNILNIPSHGTLATKMRSAFIAAPGWKIVGGDFSNFELRIIAECAEDPLWDKVFLEDGDLHTELCVRTFGISYDDVKKPYPLKPEYKYRDVQKTIDFGLAYGMSEYKFADYLDTHPKKAKAIINDFFSIIPKVKMFLDMLAWVGRTKGYIRTMAPFRRIRWFPKWSQELNPDENFKIIGEIERASKNTIPQGTNADCIKLTLCRLQKIIDDNNYPVYIRLSIYDEIVTECKEEFAEEWKLILEKTMIESAQVIIKRIPIKADVKISDCWTK